MKALTVHLSVVSALGYRLDSRPYLDIAVETPDALREQARSKARKAYWKAARAGLNRARNVAAWQAKVAGSHVPQLLTACANRSEVST